MASAMAAANRSGVPLRSRLHRIEVAQQRPVRGPSSPAPGPTVPSSPDRRCRSPAGRSPPGSRRMLPQMCSRTRVPMRVQPVDQPASRRARRTPRRSRARPATPPRRPRRSGRRRPRPAPGRSAAPSPGRTRTGRGRTPGSSKKSIISALMPRRSAASAQGPSIQPSISFSRADALSEQRHGLDAVVHPAAAQRIGHASGAPASSCRPAARGSRRSPAAGRRSTRTAAPQSAASRAGIGDAGDVVETRTRSAVRSCASTSTR